MPNTQCTWEWKTLNGKNGYKVTASNGNYIFLPAAGERYKTNLRNAGSKGNYWSSTLYPYRSYEAYYLYFYLNDHAADCYDGGLLNRHYGRSVRPVCSE